MSEIKGAVRSAFHSVCFACANWSKQPFLARLDDNWFKVRGMIGLTCLGRSFFDVSEWFFDVGRQQEFRNRV